MDKKRTAVVLLSLAVSQSVYLCIVTTLVKEGVLYAGGAWLVTLTVGMGVTYLVYESINY